MFVIADARHIHPSYFWKTDVEGKPLISINISDAKVFKVESEAENTLKKFKHNSLFEFKIYPLVIKK